LDVFEGISERGYAMASASGSLRNRERAFCERLVSLGHESLDLTLHGKDVESEEAQGHATSSSLALYGISDRSNQSSAGRR